MSASFYRAGLEALQLRDRARPARPHRGVFDALTQGRLALSVLMNLVLAAAIGAALARHPIRARTALLLGAGLSLAVELTQLTATWGLYPCRYREASLDDLILNVLGVALGFRVMRRRAKHAG